MAISDWPGLACQSAYGPLDVIGVNEYFGWFDAGGGGDDDRDALGPFLDSVPRLLSDQGDHVTEFGFDGNRDGPVEERGTYAFQSDSVAFHLDVFASKPWLSGRDVLRAAELRGVPDSIRGAIRGPIRRTTRRGWSTSPAGSSRRSAWCRRSTTPRRQIAP